MYSNKGENVNQKNCAKLCVFLQYAAVTIDCCLLLILFLFYV